MDNGLFRKKSIERISSPEQLHDYMRVTSPRLWMLLAAVVLLLAGFIVYASRTTIENTMPIRVTVENYHLTAEQSGTGEEKDATLIYTEIPIDQMDTVKTGMQVRFGLKPHITADNQVRTAAQDRSAAFSCADSELLQGCVLNDLQTLDERALRRLHSQGQDQQTSVTQRGYSLGIGGRGTNDIIVVQPDSIRLSGMNKSMQGMFLAFALVVHTADGSNMCQSGWHSAVSNQLSAISSQ
jgi:hypothetical protein